MTTQDILEILDNYLASEPYSRISYKDKLITTEKILEALVKENPPQPKYFFDQDDSCHNYMIPYHLKSTWNDLWYKTSELDEDTEEFENVIDKINTEFSQYRIDGISSYSFENPKEL